MVNEVYAAMQEERLGGLTLSEVVGGGDPQKVAEAGLATLLQLGLIQKDTRILDLGCGCGRFALGLHRYLDPATRYVGTDLVPGLIDFCRRHISARRPNFEFYLVDEKNPSYERFVDAAPTDGLKLADAAALDGAFDLIIASSVFTHLDEASARAMLGRIRGWLAPGGKACLTFFILDARVRELIDAGRLSLFEGEDARAPVIIRGRQDAVGFDAALLEAMAVEAGFPGLSLVQRGTWSGVPGPQYQDLVLLDRDGLPMPVFDAARYLELNPDVAAAGMDAREHYERHGKKEKRRWI